MVHIKKKNLKKKNTTLWTGWEKSWIPPPYFCLNFPCYPEEQGRASLCYNNTRRKWLNGERTHLGSGSSCLWPVLVLLMMVAPKCTHKEPSPQLPAVWCHQFSSVQSLSRVRLFATPWIASSKWSWTPSPSSLLMTFMMDGIINTKTNFTQRGESPGMLDEIVETACLIWCLTFYY